MDDTLGILGVGKLAEFVVAGLRRGGDRRSILLSPRGAERAGALARRFGCTAMPDNQGVVDGAAIVLVATPPKETVPCLAALAWGSGRTLLSVAIDVRRSRLAAAAPGAHTVRAMPSNSVALNICPTPVFPPNEPVERLLATLGPVHALDTESAFDAATALAGYHLWCYALMDEMTRAAEAAGLPRATAVGMVAGLTRAAAEFALTVDPALPVRTPLDENAGPGSMTRRGFDELEGRGAFAPWRIAYAAALARLGEGYAAAPR